MTRWTLLLGFLAGCGGQAISPPGYLLLDKDAREAGLTVEVGGWSGAPLLPLQLKTDETVTLLSAGGRVPIVLRPSQLAWVRGARAGVDFTEVKEDRLTVDGTDAAVRLLADMLGGEAGVRADGRWDVRASDIYERASFMTEPAGVRDVEPATLGAATAQRSAFVPATGGAHRPELVVGGGSAASAVGVYVTAGRVLILDAEGGFSLEGCNGSDRVAGRVTVEDGLVRLATGDGELAVLTLAGDTLRDPAGAVYSPITLTTGVQ